MCTSTAINISALKTDAPSGMYVGDYVDNLRRLVESYRIEHGFSDGSDQVVMSLKEDIHRVTETCRAPSSNLIKTSGDIAADASKVNSPWLGTHCGVPDGAVGYFDRVGAASEAEAFCLCAKSTSDVASVRQDVGLEAGEYILSWYGSANRQASGFRLRTSAGANLTAQSVGVSTLSDLKYSRYYAKYNIAEGGTYQVYVDAAGGVADPDWKECVGAPKLERITTANHPTGATADVPTDFELTGADGLHEVSGCTDKDGSSFRTKHWNRYCVPVCDDGIGTGCLESIGAPRCYWETSFDLGQRDIERGAIMPRGGFAIGNFNYRVQSVAVNFVGTALRSCNGDPGVSCFSQGFIPYSLVHSGPFTVINHAGNQFLSSLFDGRIEHAKGLALERYLSNPLSSADNGLIEPFSRSEFIGRPLDGAYVLRVWEESGVNFDSIEDVQLLLKYRYWSRLN
ncbi:MAG: hypothetical protein QM784_35335 [Polyangiaceae bacterium]